MYKKTRYSENLCSMFNNTLQEVNIMSENVEMTAACMEALMDIRLEEKS